MGQWTRSQSSPGSGTDKLRPKQATVSSGFREWSVRAIRPVARFALRHWIRHDELIRVRQQVRYLSLAHLLARLPEPPLDLTLFELSVFSQNGEDGVLQEILRRIGVKRPHFVEIGASSNESNCLLLADAFGWSGIFIDASEEETEALRRKYRAVPEVRIIQILVTPENLQDTLRRELIGEEFDVLSIDVDGNDYWLWASLQEYRPRVVIIEYNASQPHDTSVVQPNDSAKSWDGTDSFGASLGALRLLAHEKGYRLVHTDLSGTNAFFVREDLAGSGFLSEDLAQVRSPNYFLYGLNHRESRRVLRSQTDGSPERTQTRLSVSRAEGA
jgi:hypothetical protein